MKFRIVDEFLGLNDEILDLKFISLDKFIVCSNSESLRISSIKTGKGKLLHGHKDLCTAIDI